MLWYNLGVILFYLILILGLFLRLKGFEVLPLGDEGYSLFIAKSPCFTSIFQDAGNPWFYFLIIKSEYLMFHFNLLGYKLTSLIFNMGAIIALFYTIKKNFNLKTANIAAFLGAINLVLIYYAPEIRCYSLTMLLSPLIVYFLFRVLQKRKNIYFVIYALLGIIAINTHYFEAIFLFLNFIFGVFYLKNKKSALIKFIILNCAILLSFAPFFILVSYKGAILDKGFNLWLEDITAGLILRQIAFILGGLISFILSIIFFIKAFFNKGFNFKKRLWLTYLIYIIFASIILSIILSYSIRPMITERYYCYLVPLFITFLSIIFANYKKKIYVVLFLIWIVSMQLNTKIKDTRSFYRFEHQIFNKVQNNKDNYIIIRIMTKYYLDTQKGFENVNIITFPTGEKNELQKNVQNKISEILKNNKNAVIYTTLLKPDKSNPAANYTCFYDKKTDLCLWQIKAKP